MQCEIFLKSPVRHIHQRGRKEIVVNSGFPDFTTRLDLRVFVCQCPPWQDQHSCSYTRVVCENWNFSRFLFSRIPSDRQTCLEDTKLLAKKCSLRKTPKKKFFPLPPFQENYPKVIFSNIIKTLILALYILKILYKNTIFSVT